MGYFPGTRQQNRRSYLNSIEVELNYKEYDFTSRVKVTSTGQGFMVAVYLDRPVPEKLIWPGRSQLGVFPCCILWQNVYDGRRFREYCQNIRLTILICFQEARKLSKFYGLSTFDDRGRNEFIVPQPFSKGNKLVLAPEDSDVRVSISSESEINLFDGRNLAQNGTFVVRSISLPT
jgi:hypothetical protein